MSLKTQGHSLNLSVLLHAVATMLHVRQIVVGGGDFKNRTIKIGKHKRKTERKNCFCWWHCFNVVGKRGWSRKPTNTFYPIKSLSCEEWNDFNYSWFHVIEAAWISTQTLQVHSEGGKVVVCTRKSIFNPILHFPPLFRAETSLKLGERKKAICYTRVYVSVRVWVASSCIHS